MVLEQLYLQHSKLLDNLEQVDLEPHPVRLETAEEALDRARKAIARALEYQYCLRDKNNELTYGNLKFHIQEITGPHQPWFDSNSNQVILDPGILRFHIQGTTESIHQNRSLYIHRCVHCGTQNEASGVDTDNIICDTCAAQVLDKVFLQEEDYKHETLIFFDEE
jgi:hypothetical protein